MSNMTMTLVEKNSTVTELVRDYMTSLDKRAGKRIEKIITVSVS